MMYLAIQTFALLAVTAAAFFALGYGFHRKFARARVVVSDQPPAEPPPQHREENTQQTAFIQSLREQLLSKERELKSVLERTSAVPAPVVNIESERELERLRTGMETLKSFQRDLEARNRELANRSAFLEQELEEMRNQDFTPQSESPPPAPRPEALQTALLSAEMSLKSALAEELRVENERLKARLVEVQSESERAQARLQERLESIESDRAAALAEGLTYQTHTRAMEEQLKELHDENQRLRSDGKVEALEESLREERRQREVTEQTLLATEERLHSHEQALFTSEQALRTAEQEIARLRQPAPAPIAPAQPEELRRAAEAIWEDAETSLESSLEEDSAVLARLDELSRQNDRMQAEFLEKIQSLELTVQNLRSENEMALAAAMDLRERHAGEAVDWNPEPAMPDAQRDALVEALWKSEGNAGDQDLQAELDRKERELRDMEARVRDLARKVDPELTGPDDLQLIKGIGPYIRGILEQQYGIRTFEQVAHLSEAQISEISSKLFFKDKIQREHWREQARELHFKKYNQAV